AALSCEPDGSRRDMRFHRRSTFPIQSDSARIRTRGTSSLQQVSLVTGSPGGRVPYGNSLPRIVGLRLWPRRLLRLRGDDRVDFNDSPLGEESLLEESKLRRRQD